MTANELLPCPFCGAEPLVENICDQVFVSCPTVHLEPIVHSCGALQMGIDRWNRRAPLTRAALAASPLVQEIVAEAVREALGITKPLAAELLQWIDDELGRWPTDTAYADDLARFAAAIRARGEVLASSPVAVSIAPETDAKPQGRWCWACLRHEVQADGWCRKCGGMTGQPQEKGE